MSAWGDLLYLTHNRFCQLLDPGGTICFQSRRLDFKDVRVIIYNVRWTPGIGEKETNLIVRRTEKELAFSKHTLAPMLSNEHIIVPL